jgi:rare lipoprotein A
MRASFYGPRFHGRRTANGERFDRFGLTAAHRTLPFGSLLRVTYPRSGRSIVVRVNDRGPYIRGRDLDLSEGAALRIGMHRAGVARLQVQRLA